MASVSVTSAVIGYLFLLGGVAYAIQDVSSVGTEGRAGLRAQQEKIVTSGQAIAVEGCNRDYRSAKHFRDLFASLRAGNLQTYKAGKETYEKYREADAFYAKEYARIQLPDCRITRDILTLNPHKKVTVPRPLYPKG